MIKKFLACCCLCGITMWSVAQLSPENRRQLRQQEDSLKTLAFKIVNGQSAAIRFSNDSLFTRLLVKALKTPHSFGYPFDSLQTISRLYAPDSSFRIFTWQMVVSDNLTRQHGAIQMRTADGSLKLFPLIDKSDVTDRQVDAEGGHLNWIGAVYYRIILTRSSNTPFYTLLGYDEHNLKSHRKIIEVLSFQNEEPRFGGRLFSFEEDADFRNSQSRYIMEYRKTAGARLTYDDDLQMIIFEHLVSETGEPQKKWTYIPDGDYEGFKWKNGKWVHVDKVFDQVTPLGKEPVPLPVKDAQGRTMDDKLKDNVPAEEKPETPAPVKKADKKAGGGKEQ